MPVSAPKSGPTDAAASTARELAARMHASPSPTQFADALVAFRDAFDLDTEAFAGTLDVYASIFDAGLVPLLGAEPRVAIELARVFGTAGGLGALLSRLASAPQHEVAPLIRVLESALEPPAVVARLLDAAPRPANSLLFGSRVLNVAASRLTDSWTANAAAYTAWLAQQLLAAPLWAADAALFDRAAKLGAPVTLLRAYLEPQNHATMQAVWLALRRTQQYFVFSHALVDVLPAAPGAAARLLLDLGVDAELAYDVCLRLPAGLTTIRAAVVLARESHKLLPLTAKLIDAWSSRISIEGATLASRQTLTQILLVSCCSLTPEDAGKLAHSAPFLDGVSLHLGSSSANVRKLGTLVAETFAKQAGQKLEFGITYDDHDWWLGVDALDAQQSRFASSQASDFESILRPTQKAPVEAEPDKDSDDEDDYVDSDEETTPPFYLKDLVEYLQSDKYSEVHAALTTGAALILRKAQLGSEVPQYARDVLRAACALTDKFSITRFAELRQGLLNAVVTANPVQAQTIVSMFKTGDWSLAQRQSLLNALVFAAHELAQGQSAPEFERLPPALHRLFVSDEDTHRFAIPDVGRLSVTEPGLVLGTAPFPAQSSKSSGTVVRQSQRLKRSSAISDSSAGTTAPTPKRRNLFSPVSHLFFFPLVAAPPPLRASSYDALVYAQWLRTLGILVVEAYPTQHMPDMVDELWPVIMDVAAGRGLQEIVIEEALYTCLVMVITVAGGLIVERHANDVGVLIDKSFERVRAGSEPHTQKLAAAAGAKLAELAQRIEQQLLGSGITAPA